MSIQAISWVLEHSDARLGDRLVLLGLADFAHADGRRAFPSVDSLASHARMSRRAVQASLRKLEADGHIAKTGSTQSGTTVYEVRGVASSPVQNATDGGAESGRKGAESDKDRSDSSPDPSRTRHTRQEKNNGASEPIGFGEWLEHHCALTGQQMPRLPTKARAELARKFGELVGEGRSLEDMKLASVGAHDDEWRRKNAKDYPRNVLVFSTIDELIDKGRKAKPRASGKRFVRQGPRRA